MNPKNRPLWFPLRDIPWFLPFPIAPASFEGTDTGDRNPKRASEAEHCPGAADAGGGAALQARVPPTDVWRRASMCLVIFATTRGGIIIFGHGHSHDHQHCYLYNAFLRGLFQGWLPLGLSGAEPHKKTPPAGGGGVV